MRRGSSVLRCGSSTPGPRASCSTGYCKRLPLPSARPGRIRGPDSAEGKPQLDPGAALLCILRARAPAVRLGNTPREGKAETEARREAGNALSAEKGVEYSRQALLANPRPPIPH